MGRAASRTDDPRAQALAAATAALAVHSAVTAAKDPATAASVGISISLGKQESQSKTHDTRDTAAGSTVAAGGNLAITATGAGSDSKLTVQGSHISAGNNATLLADGKVDLLAAQDIAKHQGTNSSSSASIGVAYSVGAQSGWSINASASKGKGSSEGSDVTQVNTHVVAGNTLTLQSGGDINLKGAVVAGNTVKAEVGGDLNIE